jgi:hypothetical protein
MEKIELIGFSKLYTDFMSMENGVAKNVFYYKNITQCQFNEATILKKDGCIHYSYSSVKISKTKNSYYAKRVGKDGFTIDEKGKLKVWYNKSVFQIPLIEEIFKYFRFNWLHKCVIPYITKTILEKMFAGKITNNLDVVKEYLKLMRIKASPALFFKLINESYFTKQDVLRHISVAENVDNFIKYALFMSSKKYPAEMPTEVKEKEGIISDMIKEAQILNKKINYNWSLLRLKTEHSKWTKEIMKAELDLLEDVSIPNVDIIDKYTPAEFKLLKTQKEVFVEGTMMNHCLYTAYWHSIKTGRYLAYHVKYNNEECTLGLTLNVNNDKIDVTYQQCYLAHNKLITPTMKKFTTSFVENLNQKIKTEKLIINQPETSEMSWV